MLMEDLILRQQLIMQKICRIITLFWYEEPGDPLDFELHKELGPITTQDLLATGENLFSQCRTLETS